MNTNRPVTNLEAARRLRGWTQNDLAQRVTCDRAIISRLEAGEREGSPWLRRRIADVLGLTATELTETAGNVYEEAAA